MIIFFCLVKLIGLSYLRSITSRLLILIIWVLWVLKNLWVLQWLNLSELLFRLLNFEILLLTCLRRLVVLSWLIIFYKLLWNLLRSKLCVLNHLGLAQILVLLLALNVLLTIVLGLICNVLILVLTELL